MDDKTFDEAEAKDWIRGIESVKQSIRDKDIYPAINNWINENNLKNFLDVGCGQGICSEKLNLVGRNYTGVEPSQVMIDRANELYKDENCRFVKGNIYDLPFANESFDGLFSILVFHLLSDLDTAASELSRILEPGGKFHIITANPDSYKTWKSFYKEMKLDGKRLDGTMLMSDGSKSNDTLYLHTTEEIHKSLQKYSLIITQSETFRISAIGEKTLVSFMGSKSK